MSAMMCWQARITVDSDVSRLEEPQPSLFHRGLGEKQGSKGSKGQELSVVPGVLEARAANGV